MNEEERRHFKEKLKEKFRKKLLQDIDALERASELQGVPASRIQLIRELRTRILQQMTHFRSVVPLVCQEEIDIHITAYCEMMDEFIRLAMN